MLLRKCTGGGTWPVRLEGGGPGEQRGTCCIPSFGNIVSRFHLDVVLFHVTLSDGK